MLSANETLIPHGDSESHEAHSEHSAWTFHLVAVAFLCSFLVLLLSMILSRFLHKKKIMWMSDAGIALLAGILIGGMFNLAKVTQDIEDMMTFKFPIFFYVLLPMIMWFAGYTLSIRPFLLNYESISLTAFLGTALSTVIVAVIMWGAGALGWCYQMNFGLNFAFGAMISATDPVAVIAIFGALGAKEDLYMNVFGESVLNDAVALVIYESVKSFIESDTVVSVKEVMSAIGIFIGIFVGSALLGAAIAFLASLGYYTGFFNPMLLPSTPKPITDQNEGETKDPSTIGNEKQVKPQPTVNIRIAKMSFIDPGSSGEAEVGEDTMEEVVHEESAIYETVVVILSGLCAYMTAVGLGLSGITSIVVAGMIMSCYVAPNLSPLSQEWVRVVSMVLAVTFELFAFVYIGITTFLVPLPFVQSVTYIAISVFAIGISRAIHLYPICAFVNFFRLKKRHIDYKSQFMMWWVGLRGPMAFALSLDAGESFGEAGMVMKTTVLAVTILTVYVNGGASAYLLEYLRLRKVDEVKTMGDEDTFVDLETTTFDDGTAQRSPTGVESPSYPLSPSTRGHSGSSSKGLLAAVRQFNSGAFVERLEKVDSLLKKKLSPSPSNKGSQSTHK